MERTKLQSELVLNAPTKDHLATHDGIVYFPNELMPAEQRDNVNDTHIKFDLKGNVP